MNRSLFLVSCVVGAVAAAGCLAAEEPELETSVATSDLYVNSSWTWANGEVPVCWEDMNPAYESQRNAVRQAVEQTWQREARLHFSGWGGCDWYLWTNPQVRIRVADEQPHTVNLGTLMGHQYGGMTLNFTFQNWSQACQSTADFCIRAIAVHEFGHALGFAHEQNRPDTPGWCNDVQGNGADWTIGPWDTSSIMNYCNPAWNNNGMLSRGDIVGVQTVYGKRANSIVGVNSLCLAAPGPAADTTMAHCAPEASQQFTIAPLTTFPMALGNRNGQFLDVWAWDTSIGAPIRSWARNQPDTPNQQWNLVNVALRGNGGACLDVPNASNAAGTLTQLFGCNRGAAQQWTFTAAGEIRTPNGKCLDAQWGSTADGTPVWIWDCNGTAAQKWRWYGSAILGPGNKCLEVAGGATADGTQIQLNTCNWGVHQRWSTVGQLRSALTANRCINAATSFLGLGPALSYTCFDAPAETWEIFP